LTTKSPVATLTMGITAMEQRLIRPEVLCQSALSKSLKRRINIHKRYLDYYRVVTPLKNREWMASFVAMIQYPYFFIEFTKRLPQIVARRLPY
jgi:hypothetical protein